jgi:hypothetical protein
MGSSNDIYYEITVHRDGPILVGSQRGSLTAGAAGSATFAATASEGASVSDGATTINWCDASGTAAAAPTGLSATATNMTSGSSTVTVSADSTAAAGTYYFKVISGESSSGVTAVTVADNTQSTANAITGFTLGGVNGTINETDHTIAVTLPFGTDVTSLTPTITASNKATVSPTTAQNFTNSVVYTVTAENESTQIYTVTVTIAPDTRSTANAITGFTLSGVNGTIDETNHTIAVTLPYGTSVTSLTPTVTVSENATVSPTTAQNFTSPVVYTVKAENESTQTYTVTVTIAPDTRSTAKAITGFTLSGVNGTIDETNHTIAVTVPYGTDVSSLTPTVTVSDKATVSPTTAQNFTSPVVYTVTAENESTQTYTVTVTIAPDTRSTAKAITRFTLSGVNGTINETDHTIAVTVPYGTSVTSLTPTVTLSEKATVSPLSGTAQNFTSSVVYTVKAENDSTQDYTVTVTIAPDTRSTAKAITGFTLSGVNGTINETDHTIVVTLPYGTSVTSLTPTVTASEKATVSPLSGTAQSFASSVVYTVTAENDSTQDYTVTVTIAPDTRSTAKAITGFTLGGVNGTIDDTNHTIAVTLHFGTDVTNLTPTVTVSDKATVSPTMAQNFTNSVTYTVTAENESTQTYTVTVTIAPDTRSTAKAITGFTLSGVNGTINDTNHTIAVTLPFGTDVTSLTPTITASDKATVTPTTAQNFRNPVTYTVKAENESTQTYTVTVTITDKILTNITTPTAIAGLTNGTAKIAAALGLPSTVTLVTDSGNVTANVTWNVASCSYDASSTVAQTFTVSGTVTLPTGVVNTNSVSLTTSISVTVNAASGSSSGGGTSSGGSSGSGSSNNSSITVTTDAGTTTAAQTISATTGSNGVAAANVTKNQITDMMKAASEKAQAQNTQTALEIKVDSGSTATGVSVTIPQSATSSLTDGVDTLTISSPVVSVTFDDKALAEINKDTTGDITITARKPADTALSDADKAIIGDRPVYDLKVTSGSTTISTFGGGTATVSVPYTPTAGEDTSKIVVYYISGSGELIMVPGCVYDASTKTVTFKTTHFSSYAVGYNNVSFTDVSGWYADYVNYLAARGIINGTGDGKFSPDANITRAQFVTILANLSGNNLTGYTSSAFSDVSTSDWYFAAVQWANKNGIASGYNGAFNPNANITREQMAVMLFNYAKYAGIDVSNVEGMSVQEFSDYDSISNWALTPIQWAINKSIISGNGDSSFAPAANATRAQAAKMIAVLLQDMIGS